MKIIILLILFIILILHDTNCDTFINKKELPNNIVVKGPINLIYTTVDGIYKIFIDDYFTNYNIKNKKKKIKEIIGLENIDTGFYNYKYNYLGLLKDNNIYKYDLSTKTLSNPILYSKYFNGIEDKISCLFYLKGIVYIFIKNTIYTYNLNIDSLVNKYESQKLFEKIPINIDSVFINYNDIEQYNPIPYIYVLKNKKYYKYKFLNNKFKFIESNIFMFNTNNIIIKNNIKYKFKKSGLYRIYLVGGGNTYGGKGGLIFNDHNIGKNDILNCIIGKQGLRIPVNNKLNSKSKLPYNGSCAGSGGTSIYKKNELLITAGGGGGWVSEIIKSPNICNSVNYFDKKKYKPNLFFPIKKILIISDISNINKYKIVIEKLDIIVKNYDDIKIEVIEEPKYDYLELKDKKYKYQTTYSTKGHRAFIEIKFDKILVDYNIKIDYHIISTNKNKDFINSNLILFDEQNKQFKINNFNTNFKKNITSINLLNYFSNSTIPSIESNYKYNSNNKYFYLKGGDGGGGFAQSNKYDNFNICGGGGGYINGKSISLIPKGNYNINYPIEYVGATGGTSYIKKVKLNNIENMYDQFINTYNENDGYIVIKYIK